MKYSITIFLLISFLFIPSSICHAENANSDDFQKFSTYYYLNPKPQRLPNALENFFKLEIFSDEQICDEHCRDITSYFFARAAGSNKNVIEKYKLLFENGTHEERGFLLKVFQLCGDENVKIFLESKLKEKAFAGEKEQIELILKEGILIKFDPVTEPINEAGDLDFLWAEFMVTGNDEAIKRIISVLHFLEDGTGMEIALGGATRWSLDSNCRQHKKVLEICKMEWPKLGWPAKKILREIIAEVDGTAIDDYLADKKMIKITTRNITPGIEKKSFAALPITGYLFEDKYARIQEESDPAMKIHGLIIVNEPDVWMINLWDKTARHIVDTDPDGTFHAPIIPDENTNIEKELLALEFGSELEFMKNNNAQISQIEIEQKNYDLYSLEIEGVKVELVLEKEKQVPYIVRVFEGEEIVHAIAYDEYNANLKPDLKLFDPPEDIEIFEASGEDAQPIQIDKKSLEERVKEHLKEGSSVDLRGKVDDLFLLADIYADEGNEEGAIKLYQKALSVDSWRLEYQLKLAKILDKRGEKSPAVEKARTVYQYAENENLIDEAKKILSELGEFPEEKAIELQALAKNIEIVIVPIGKVNQRFLKEVKEGLQDKMGIWYSISEKILDVGKVDRSFVDSFLERTVERIEHQLPQEDFQALFSELNLSKTVLEARDPKIKLIDAFFKKIELPKEEVEQFHNRVKELENEGQYDTERLLTELENVFKATEKPTIKGYLGITEADIFTKDYNFLYGWARSGYGVMSYHRFKSDFTEEISNRQRLCNRAVKQGISSSFFILGIPRCSSPTCARAYPHNLTEYDQKGIEICPWCKEQLDLCKKNE